MLPPTPTPTPTPSPDPSTTPTPDDDDDAIVGDDAGDEFDPIAVTAFEDSILATVIPIVAVRITPIVGVALR